jgi:hypothetical protein
MSIDYTPPTRAPILFCYECAQPKPHRYVETVALEDAQGYPPPGALSHEFACCSCGTVRRWGYDRPCKLWEASDAHVR